MRRAAIVELGTTVDQTSCGAAVYELQRRLLRHSTIGDEAGNLSGFICSQSLHAVFVELLKKELRARPNNRFRQSGCRQGSTMTDQKQKQNLCHKCMTSLPIFTITLNYIKLKFDIG